MAAVPDKIRLSKAVGYSRERLGPFRDKRLELMKEYVGFHYSSGSGDKVPINLLELAVNIYLQRLVANSPAVSITTNHMQLRDLCQRFELAANHLVGEIDLASSLENAVTAAMFCMGIVKVGLNRSQIEVGGVLHDSGQPFADFVSLDDWVHDMTANNFENVQFEGNFYTLTKTEAESIFPSKVHEKLVFQEQQNLETRDHDLSEGSASNREEYQPLIRCLDLWLPKENLIVQCQASDDEKEPIEEILNVFEWDGPERGPYHKLGFGVVENNTLPLAPAMLWRDLHELSNELYRKLGRQASRQKSLLAYQKGEERDAKKILDASDGESIGIDNPNAAQEVNFGGIRQESLAFLLATKDLFTYFAGNLDMLGGLGPQADTLGQDQLLSASASMRIQRMQKNVYRFTEGIVKDLCYWLFTDPYINIPVVKRVKGFDDVTVTVPFGPEERRENDFVEYNIKIEPYSMQHKTPESKLQGIRTILNEMVIPLIPMMQQQGIGLNLEALFKKIGKLANLTELDEILVYQNPTIQNEPVGEAPPKAQTTTRRYERINRPGATNQGKSQILQQALLGSKPQAAELASMFRPTG